MRWLRPRRARCSPLPSVPFWNVLFLLFLGMFNGTLNQLYLRRGRLPPSCFGQRQRINAKKPCRVIATVIDAKRSVERTTTSVLHALPLCLCFLTRKFRATAIVWLVPVDFSLFCFFCRFASGGRIPFHFGCGRFWEHVDDCGCFAARKERANDTPLSK